MRNRKLLPFVAGVLLGVAIVTAGTAGAAIMRSGWDRFDEQFQLGYITGFLDLLLIARNEHAGGPLDRRFPHIIGAKNYHWHKTLNEIWEREDYRELTLYDALNVTAHELTKSFDSQDWVQRQRYHQLRSMGLPTGDQPRQKAGQKASATGADKNADGGAEDDAKRSATGTAATATKNEAEVDPAQELLRQKRRLERRSKSVEAKVQAKIDKLEQRVKRIRSRAADVPVAPKPEE